MQSSAQVEQGYGEAGSERMPGLDGRSQRRRAGCSQTLWTAAAQAHEPCIADRRCFKVLQRCSDDLHSLGTWRGLCDAVELEGRHGSRECLGRPRASTIGADHETGVNGLSVIELDCCKTANLACSAMREYIQVILQLLARMPTCLQ